MPSDVRSTLVASVWNLAGESEMRIRRISRPITTCSPSSVSRGGRIDRVNSSLMAALEPDDDLLTPGPQRRVGADRAPGDSDRPAPASCPAGADAAASRLSGESRKPTNATMSAASALGRGRTSQTRPASCPVARARPGPAGVRRSRPRPEAGLSTAGKLVLRRSDDGPPGSQVRDRGCATGAENSRASDSARSTTPETGIQPRPPPGTPRFR